MMKLSANQIHDNYKKFQDRIDKIFKTRSVEIKNM